MTDLEITRLCAEAIGLVAIEDGPQSEAPLAYCVQINGEWIGYDPLHDDAQAMALVKKMKLELKCVIDHWHAWDQYGAQGATLCKDLNRAICECVAKMQEAKATGMVNASHWYEDRDIIRASFRRLEQERDALKEALEVALQINPPVDKLDAAHEVLRAIKERK